MNRQRRERDGHLFHDLVTVTTGAQGGDFSGVPPKKYQFAVSWFTSSLCGTFPEHQRTVF
ncbi:hypothetical protein CA13_29520 [Planctomycetes bacterium CA13]|uniref:Uncharacterized protein n=1 Tax=Novipirellula herctigrandis TaxID=2527986 RepID=A0A5C5Z2B6_9BACT|nr:hypothetical protein CA13_29520 [Planctomycetes bacterium CA13]